MGDAYLEKPVFGCGHCHMHDSCPMGSEDGPHPGNLGPDSQGAALVVATTLVFLLPLAVGIAGAALAPRWLATSATQGVSGCQGLGLIGGLAIGIVLARILLALRHRRRACPVGDHE